MYVVLLIKPDVLSFLSQNQLYFPQGNYWSPLNPKDSSLIVYFRVADTGHHMGFLRMIHMPFLQLLPLEMCLIHQKKSCGEVLPWRSSLLWTNMSKAFNSYTVWYLNMWYKPRIKLVLLISQYLSKDIMQFFHNLDTKIFHQLIIVDANYKLQIKYCVQNYVFVVFLCCYNLRI